MYAAKRQGRGGLAHYDAGMSAGAESRFNLESCLHGALERASSRCITAAGRSRVGPRVRHGGAAALDASELGSVRPDEFIPVAEKRA